MADNILKGIIQIEAKGVSQATNQVSTALTKTEAALKRTSTSTNQATFALTNLGRVVQDAPFGFIGIANNINPLLESFQRLKTETGSTGGALSALKGTLLGPAGLGLAVSAVSSLLVVFGDKLFSTNKSFSDAEISAARFSASLRRIKEDADNLKTSLDFQGNIQKISLQLSGLSGSGLSTAGKGVDIGQNTRLITELTTKINALSAANKKLVSDRVEVEKTFLSISGGEGTALGKAVRALGGDISAINDEIVKKLSAGDKQIVSKYRQTSEVIKDLTKQRDEAFRSILTNAASLPVDFIKPVKAKDVRIVPEKVTVDPTLSKIDLITVPIKDFKIDTSGVGLQSSSFLKDFRERNEAQIAPIREQLLQLAAIGEFAGEKISTAFTSVFSALANGESPIKALGEAIKSLVIDLISAAIRAFIVTQILNLLAPGLGKATGGGLGRLIGGFGGFRAGGGPVAPGQSYVVGENGRELFVPNVPGTIVPNGRMGQFGGGFMGNVVFRISGNSLVGVLANANSSQFRLG